MRPSLQRLLAPYFFFWARLVLRKHHPRIVAVTVLPPACEPDWSATLLPAATWLTLYPPGSWSDSVHICSAPAALQNRVPGPKMGVPLKH